MLQNDLEEQTLYIVLISKTHFAEFAFLFNSTIMLFKTTVQLSSTTVLCSYFYLVSKPWIALDLLLSTL